MRLCWASASSSTSRCARSCSWAAENSRSRRSWSWISRSRLAIVPPPGGSGASGANCNAPWAAASSGVRPVSGAVGTSAGGGEGTYPGATCPPTSGNSPCIIGPTGMTPRCEMGMAEGSKSPICPGCATPTGAGGSGGAGMVGGTYPGATSPPTRSSSPCIIGPGGNDGPPCGSSTVPALGSVPFPRSSRLDGLRMLAPAPSTPPAAAPAAKALSNRLMPSAEPSSWSDRPRSRLSCPASASPSSGAPTAAPIAPRLSSSAPWALRVASDLSVGRAPACPSRRLTSRASGTTSSAA